MPLEGTVAGTRRVKLRDVNAHLACVLCGGYLVDATTIVECLHSFCRSCIIKYLDTNNFCPICDVQIHKAKPFLNIKPDKTLQDIVYKLVPGLFQAEMRRRREFYSQHPEQIALTTPEERGVGVERIIYSPEDSISLSLEYYDSGHPGAEDGEGSAARDPTELKALPNGDVSNGAGPPPPGPAGPRNIPHKRYLRCPAVVTIGHLKKFLRLKFDLNTAYRVDVIHRGVCLPEDYTLMDVAYIYTWKRSEPMEFMYRIHEPPRPSTRRKRRPAAAVSKEMTNGEAEHCDLGDDPPPPKLERMTENPTAEEDNSTDAESLLPPTIDIPEGDKKLEEKIEESVKPKKVAEETSKRDDSEKDTVKENEGEKEKKAEPEVPASHKSTRVDASCDSGGLPKKAEEAPHAVQTPITRPHSTPGAAAAATPPAAARPHHPQQQQLPSPRPASSPPALVAQQTQGSAGDGRKDAARTPELPKETAATEPSSKKDDETSSHPERKRSRESEEDEATAAKRDRNGALDLSGGSSRLSGDGSPPPSSPPSAGPSNDTQKGTVQTATVTPVPSGRNAPAAMAIRSKSPALPKSANNSLVPSEAVVSASKTDTSSASIPATSVTSTPSTNSSQDNSKASPDSNVISATSTADNNPSSINTNTVASSSSAVEVTSKMIVTTAAPKTSASSAVNCSAITSSTITTSTTTTVSSSEVTPRVSASTTNMVTSQTPVTPTLTPRQGKITKGQSTQTLQSIAQNLARNAQQKQLQQQKQQQQQQQQQHQQQQKTPLKTQQSSQTPQKPLQHVTPLQTPKYTPQTKLQQQLQQQSHHQLLQHQLQQQLQQHNQQQLQHHAQLLRQQQIQLQLQQNIRNSQAAKQTIHQTKISNSTVTTSSTTTSPSPVTITISPKTTPARQNSPLNRTNASPVNAVSPQTKSSGLTLSLGQLNHHNSLTNNRPSSKRGTPQVANSNSFLQNHTLHHHHLPHISISQHSNSSGSNSTSPASATSPGYSDPLSPLSSLSSFPIRTSNLRSPPPPLAPPPPPPPPSHSSNHAGSALRIPVPPSGKPRPSSLSSSSPSPSPPGDQHSSTPSPNGTAHQKASPNGSPGLSGRHDHFGAHHLHGGPMFSPHGLRFRQQMELQNRHIAEQHLQQAAHQQSPQSVAAVAAAANPQLLQQWHQLQQLHLRQQQQAANATQSAAALSAGGYPMDWYTYPHSVKLLEYFMKLGHLPMFPFNNNTTSANNNSAGSASTRK